MPSKRRKKKNKYTPVRSHRKVGSKLQSDLSNLPIELTDWIRDFIPEFLWIEYLAQRYEDYQWHQIYDDFLDALESYFDTTEFFLTGTISDFGKVPEDFRREILQKENERIKSCFEEVIGNLLLLYPQCPANWLISERFQNSKRSSYEYELATLKQSLMKLYPAKDDYCAYIRMMPLKRIFKHGKIHIAPNLEVVDLLPKYPNGCTEDERKRVEAFGRTIVNMELVGVGIEDRRHIDTNWSRYFWNHNYDISICEESTSYRREYGQDEEGLLNQIPIKCDELSKIIDEYIQYLKTQYKYDIYDSSKDEVIIGLFARISRLTKLLLSDSAFWTVDISRIMLRCLADACITLAFLVHRNDDKLFKAYVEYSRGKEKLLMLQLQDMYQGSLGPSGEDFEAIEQELGDSFSIELLSIELGSWHKLDSRKMAMEIGFDDIYRLIFDPTSGDIHGSWTSIRTMNLKACVNPLHKFHRLPNISDPPIFIEPLILAVSLYERTVNTNVDRAKFPEFNGTLVGLNVILEKLQGIRNDSDTGPTS